MNTSSTYLARGPRITLGHGIPGHIIYNVSIYLVCYASILPGTASRPCFYTSGGLLVMFHSANEGYEIL